MVPFFYPAALTVGAHDRVACRLRGSATRHPPLPALPQFNPLEQLQSVTDGEKLLTQKSPPCVDDIDNAGTGVNYIQKHFSHFGYIPN